MAPSASASLSTPTAAAGLVATGSQSCAGGRSASVLRRALESGHPSSAQVLEELPSVRARRAAPLRRHVTCTLENRRWAEANPPPPAQPPSMPPLLRSIVKQQPQRQAPSDAAAAAGRQHTDAAKKEGNWVDVVVKGMMGLVVATGVTAAVNIGSQVIDAVDSIPPLKHFEETVGVLVTGGFAGRHLIFDEKRKKIRATLQTLAFRITGMGALAASEPTLLQGQLISLLENAAKDNGVELKITEEQKRGLVTELLSFIQARDSHTESKLTSLSIKVEQLTARLAAQQAEAEAKQREMQEKLQETTASYETKVGLLVRERDDARSTTTDLLNRLGTLESELTNLKSHRTDLLSSNQELKARFEAVLSNNSALESKVTELSLAKEDILAQKVHAERVAERTRIEAEQKLAEEIERMNQVAMEERANHLAEIATISARMMAAQEEAEAEIAALQEKASRLEAQIKVLKEEQAAAAGDMAALEETLAELRAERDVDKSRIDELLDEITLRTREKEDIENVLRTQMAEQAAMLEERAAALLAGAKDKWVEAEDRASRLESEVTRLDAAKADLEMALSVAKTERDAHFADTKRTRAQLEAALIETAGLSEARDGLATSNNELRSRLEEALTTGKSLEEQVASLMVAKREAAYALEVAEAQLVDARENADRILAEELRRAREEKDEALAGLQQATQEEREALQFRVQHLEVELDGAYASLTSARTELNRLMHQMEESVKKLGCAHEESQRLMDRVAVSESKVADLEGHVAEIKGSMQSLQIELEGEREDARSVIEVLQEQRDQARSDAEAAISQLRQVREDSEREAAMINADLVTLQAQREDLESRLKAAQSRTAVLEHNEEQTKELLAILQGTVDDLKARLAEGEVTRTEKAELQEQLASARQELAVFKDIQRSDRQQIDSLRREVEGLIRARAQLEETMRRQIVMDARRFNERIEVASGSMVAQLQSLETERNSLHRSLASLTSSRQALEARMDGMMAEKTKLEMMTSTLEAQLEDARAEIEGHIEARNHLMATNNKLRAQLDRFTVEKAELDATVERMTLSRQEALEALELAEQRAETVEAETYERFARELGRLEDALKAEQLKNSEPLKEAMLLEQKVAELEDQIDALLQERAEVDERLAAAQENVDELIRTQSEDAGSIEELELELAKRALEKAQLETELKSMVTALQTSREPVRDSLAEVTARAEEADMRAAAAALRVEELETQVSYLEASLAASGEYDAPALRGPSQGDALAGLKVPDFAVAKSSKPKGPAPAPAAASAGTEVEDGSRAGAPSEEVAKAVQRRTRELRAQFVDLGRPMAEQREGVAALVTQLSSEFTVSPQWLNSYVRRSLQAATKRRSVAK